MNVSRAVSKSPEERDPSVTPWEEEAEHPPHRPPTRGNGRSLLDWVVLGLGFLLLVYIIGFLFSGGDNSSPSEGFSFGEGSVALVPIRGEIMADSTPGSVEYSQILSQLSQAENDPSVEVILLDIDSGGGSVVASKQVVAKIRSMEKPVVSWVGELGASGAYYIASASDYIVADADSITGSIGVISRQPNVQKLLEKIGISMEEITSGRLKGIGSPFNELTEEEKQVFQVLVNQAFETFVSDVKTFRGDTLKLASFEEVLDGRILSGKQALEIGLIDQVGTREEAILKAGQMGGIKGRPRLITYEKEYFSLADLFFSMGTSFGEGFRAGWMKSIQTSPELSAK